MPPRHYAYTSLTAAIDDKTSPLRQYFSDRFPHRSAVQQPYRQAAGPIVIPPGAANPGTIGAAFDFAVRMIVDPTHIPTVAMTAFPHDEATLLELIATAAAAADCRDAELPEPLARACWALALCTEVYRAGLFPGSPLDALIRSDQFTTGALLEVAPANAVEQLTGMHRVAADRLFPALPNPPAQLSLGPTFTASALCRADADMVIDGLLLDVKTKLGQLDSRTKVRSDVFPLVDVYQLAGYTLFDRADSHKIRTVGVYSARYGTLHRWPVDEYLTLLAGEPVDLATERERVWELLGGTATSR